MDIDDLKAAIEHGSSIEEAAEFLCRADSVDEFAPRPGKRLAQIEFSKAGERLTDALAMAD